MSASFKWMLAIFGMLVQGLLMSAAFLMLSAYVGLVVMFMLLRLIGGI